MSLPHHCTLDPSNISPLSLRSLALALLISHSELPQRGSVMTIYLHAPCCVIPRILCLVYVSRQASRAPETHAVRCGREGNVLCRER